LELDKGPDNPHPVNECDSRGQTALQLCCKNNRMSLFLRLLEASPKAGDPNVGEKGEGNEDGQTALHFAVNYSTPRFVEILLENGGSPIIPDARGQTPIDVARNLGQYTQLEMMERYLALYPCLYATEATRGENSTQPEEAGSRSRGPDVPSE